MAETKATEPEISIETDRTEYSSTDPINETVRIYNASDDILTDIVISGSIPEGYQTEDGIASHYKKRSVAPLRGGFTFRHP